MHSIGCDREERRIVAERECMHFREGDDPTMLSHGKKDVACDEGSLIPAGIPWCPSTWKLW
jgi:hypothetical protein